jgi:Tol biopolymer transport system component
MTRAVRENGHPGNNPPGASVLYMNEYVPMRRGAGRNVYKVDLAVLATVLLALVGCAPGAGETTAPGEAFADRNTPTTKSTTPTDPATTTDIPTAIGGLIAFVSDRDEPDPEHCRDSCNHEIYIMNVDGSGQTRLTNNAVSDYQPAWSPDGTRIAFASLRDNPPPENGLCMLFCVYQIYIMDADGANQTRLTDLPGQRPAWSPDGTRIAFMAPAGGDEGNWDIYIVDTDGANQIQLTDSPAYDGEPAWSPDGTQIAFVSERDGSRDIYVMDADGANQTRLTSHPKYDGAPAWSPDGAWIAFQSYRDGNPEIYVMNADGTEQTNLTEDPDWDGTPAWSPDGARIAFTSDRDGTSEIYIMNADGTGVVRLTNNSVGDGYPVWQP